ncbi:VPLPA-CTERM sorting domain-containing protein [Pseudooceanicola nitratireducens]|jgi:hypothetical protein|uniref:VPLPA-CTERM protein sorting domain-containing protein n=1 Tax=Pseudooceanicola nitratireducens TaxID=517719 RepID=A0A1I1IDT0_9RHOB|nr:VPLPA-CTERM sorting domain-containing protein [Pseudooceanicola nitratireducens]MEC7792854.1 VPLPA-CTERM sorting domain-containing protein [Pseudomonadota bacterium]MBY6157761.1 VPLPA-CTERM sorting domain-containing protein [Pseudooceanicola nitratireducens]MBY6164554.1 VPLPA-CTERM sorting domain-containing protein [Pseudooceanicola nitratireducens]SEJ19801.1 VPLPA-CTERM protein sorting domain-containing protein [Pseudooceanicola nitratireducens]SFC31913.1 VPLPA-CTERM protein sorting domain|eukprot:g16984.t1
MTNFLKTMALGAGLAFAATTASAVSVSSYDADLYIGDEVSVGVETVGYESFGNTAVSFNVMQESRVFGSFTVNPYNMNPQSPDYVTIEYSFEGGPLMNIDLTGAPANNPVLAFAFGNEVFTPGVLTFYINGVSGKGGGTVDIDLTVSAVPVAPAGVMLLSGLGALVARRRKKS